ncbi:mitogen-activated protein kinase 19 [Citrus sinensis]|nr:mitogen-activated protein kinase 19 [Citrus sinensis]
MRKKPPVPLFQKFPNVDPLALRLLQRLIAFDPKDRPTAEEALADPYFKGLAKIEREPSCQPISKLEFEFERRRVTKDDIRELIYREILEYHPQLLKDYINGTEGTNFLYPSAIGQFRKQFAYLEENGGRSGPVIPPERKHVSLPRQQMTEDTSRNFRVTDEISGNHSKFPRPPPRVPAAKPGRVVGSVMPYENGRNIKDIYDARMFYRNAVLPPQNVSPHCFFRTNTINQEKSGLESGRSSHVKPEPTQHNPAAKPTHGLPVDVNMNPYYQPQAKVDQLNERIAIDAKLLQAQSQFGAAAVAVAAHRNVGTVQYGLS